MKLKHSHKKIIILLSVVLMILTGFLWYKEQSINKAAPTRAKFVKIMGNWCNRNG